MSHSSPATGGYKGKCKYCSKLDDHLTKDHVLPKSRFPDSRLILLVCSQCNEQKGNKTIQEWIPLIVNNPKLKENLQEILTWKPERFGWEKKEQLQHSRQFRKRL